MEPQQAVAVATRLHEAVSTTVRGKPEAVRLALVALLSGGHLLIEDIPGTGKTLLGKSLAAAIGGHFGRVQCTPDLLPADLTGTSIFTPTRGEWEFRPGPIFANVVLLDEVNRASPRTQAALLEPMEEHQVTVDGSSHPLPLPFYCIATQNPLGQAGTFPLPESQLDRFAIVLSMGVPGRDAEREILVGTGGADALGAVTAVTTPAEVSDAIEGVRHVHCAPPLVEYVLDLAAATRQHAQIRLGASPRATLGLLRAAKAHAVVAGRDYVIPDDVQAVAAAAFAHRISLADGPSTRNGLAIIGALLSQIPVPRP